MPSNLQNQSLYSEHVIAALAGIAILIAYIGFTLVTLPTPTSGFRILSINPAIMETTTRVLGEDWTKLLWPMEYEMKRKYWIPGTLLPTYAVERYFGPLANYLLFSCLFIATSFASAYCLTRSLL